ncbi:RecF/RecN/SMC N terminal domain-domain-containing protein [Phakopsora pachyrhizi]|uniref:RecF/RecN/SMC N terminal domain-domain-containing protein n=1 Tax=Phakopsora pachyrhizi TaxID=170000 RepID=A0AAV0AW28_PHAPC|nr:RecF/RecN/SMC N terminal domain-domain-containing protein [Phakopsora pachyrhizi]
MTNRRTSTRRSTRSSTATATISQTVDNTHNQQQQPLRQSTRTSTRNSNRKRTSSTSQATENRSVERSEPSKRLRRSTARQQQQQQQQDTSDEKSSDEDEEVKQILLSGRTQSKRTRPEPSQPASEKPGQRERSETTGDDRSRVEVENPSESGRERDEEEEEEEEEEEKKKKKIPEVDGEEEVVVDNGLVGEEDEVVDNGVVGEDDEKLADQQSTTISHNDPIRTQPLDSTQPITTKPLDSSQPNPQSTTKPPESSPTSPQPLTPAPEPRPRTRPLPPMRLAVENLNRAGEPRLVIDQIVLVNFKSYAGRQVIGPFHKSFSAIVGPNGSGKSNTIDALLFVFGFKATKMRQGKLSELIHNSSAAPAGGFESCSVEVWFKSIIDKDGPDDYRVVPGSKLVVARTATRSNQSKYTIDGKLSNFGEVTTLLKSKGIDLDHKRFLILQGEVESIAQMKPKATTAHDEGLLEYLEDIIGTNRFKEPIDEAQSKLEELIANRAHQLERVKLVEREKAGLAARKKIADEYLARTNTLIRQQNFLWQFYIHTGQANLETLQNSMAAIDHQLKENEEAHEGDLKEDEALRLELEEEEGKYKEVEVETTALVKELERKEREMVSLSEKMKHGRGKQKKLKKSITEDEHIVKEALSTIRDSKDEIEKLRVELESKESLIEKEELELDRIRDSLKDKTQVFADQIEAKQAELAPWAAQVTSQRASLDLLRSERDLLLKKTTDLNEALSAARETVERIEEETKSKTSQLKQLSRERTEVKKGIEDATEELKKIEREEEKVRETLTVARQKAEEARSARHSSSSKNEVLKSLSKLKKQGRLPGFFGRLGDLGRIDDRYDIAISTACPQLDNLVCDTVETGQKCLSHLKQTNAGRAVIICLNALKVTEPSSPPQTPENAPRLVDLVTCKEQMFRPAFYHVLRDTLVADDLSKANRIAFGQKRWRVVTLDGKLIDSSGTMSGGGNRVSRGLMDSSMATTDCEVSEEMIASLEKETAKVEARLASSGQNREEVEGELRRLKAELPRLETQIKKLEMDLAGSTKRMDEAKRTIVDLSSQDQTGAKDKAEIKKLEAKMEVNEQELEELKQKTNEIEDGIKDLQSKIMEVGGVKLRTQQARVKDLRAMVDHSTNRLTKAEVSLSKAERDSNKHEKSLEKSRAGLEPLEVEIKELESKISSIETETEAMRDTVDQARVALEEQKERLVEIRDRRKEKLEVINVFKLRQTELKQQREKAEGAMAQAKANVGHWRKKQAELKLNLIEDDEEEEETEGQKDADVLKVYQEGDFEDFDVELTKAEVAKLEEDQERASPDLGVLKEYQQREREFMARAADLEATTRSRDEAKQLLEDLNLQRLEEFMWGFEIISGKLKEMYQMITLGGNAELELVDSLDPFSEGIIFSVMPPKKSWKNISNLSGGEKTLSSLALVFALHAFKPTPLYFMDEIDAALDFRNVSIIGNYIKDRVKSFLFIVKEYFKESSSVTRLISLLMRFYVVFRLRMLSL